MRVQTRPWPDVLSYFSTLERQAGWHIKPLLALVQFLSESAYASGLFPYTSHDILCVGRVANFVAGDGELRVQFNGLTQSFKFTYLQRPDERSPWVRKCPAAEGQAVLERILLKRLQWFRGAAA